MNLYHSEIHLTSLKRFNAPSELGGTSNGILKENISLLIRERPNAIQSQIAPIAIKESS